LTLKVGGLAGFDMSVWESGSGEEGRKKVRPHSRLRSRSKKRELTVFLRSSFFPSLSISSSTHSSQAEEETED